MRNVFTLATENQPLSKDEQLTAYEPIQKVKELLYRYCGLKLNNVPKPEHLATIKKLYPKEFNRCQKSIDKFIFINLQMLLKIADGFFQNRREIEEFSQSAIASMTRGLWRFDVSRNAKPSSVLWFWIRCALGNWKRDQMLIKPGGKQDTSEWIYPLCDTMYYNDGDFYSLFDEIAAPDDDDSILGQALDGLSDEELELIQLWARNWKRKGNKHPLGQKTLVRLYGESYLDRVHEILEKVRSHCEMNDIG